MPRSPHSSTAVAAMPGAVYAPVAGNLAAEVCPLHVGDTYLAPFEGARMESLREDEYPGMHRYAPTRGLPDFVDTVAAKLASRNALEVSPAGVIATAGATGALSVAIGSIVNPGDEVMVLAPFWPLIKGIIQAFHGRPAEVPFFDRVDSAEAAVAVLDAKRTPRTVAVYVSTPSNPTGRVLPGEWLEAIAAWARRHDLWLLSDEVYEELVYRGEHVSLGRFAPERTLSAFSFSKAYAMAGNRVGVLAGPVPAIEHALKLGTHTFYAAPTASQLAALQAMEHAGDWLAAARSSYQAVGDETAAWLGLPPPEGSTFHFVNVSRGLDERGVWGFLEDCANDGVALAPGPSCGREYGEWVRLCYTAAPPDAVRAAVRTVVRHLV